MDRGGAVVVKSEASHFRQSTRSRDSLILGCFFLHFNIERDLLGNLKICWLLLLEESTQRINRPFGK